MKTINYTREKLQACITAIRTDIAAKYFSTGF